MVYSDSCKNLDFLAKHAATSSTHENVSKESP